MVEPLTIALASWLGSQAATAFGGIIGNASDRVFVDKTRAVQKALTSGLAEPRNHDLARAIRCSQLLALQLTIKAYERLEQPRFLQRARQSGPGFSPEAITAPLSEWIRQSVINQATLDFDQTALTDEAAKQWTARVVQIQAKIDRAFTHPEPGEGAAFERLNCLVPAFDGTSFEPSMRDTLWDRFYMGAPRRQRQSVEQYKIVKRA